MAECLLQRELKDRFRGDFVFQEGHGSGVLTLSTLSVTKSIAFHLGRVSLGKEVRFIGRQVIEIYRCGETTRFVRPRRRLYGFRVVFLVRLFLNVPFRVEVFEG